MLKFANYTYSHIILHPIREICLNSPKSVFILGLYRLKNGLVGFERTYAANLSQFSFHLVYDF